MRLLRSLAAGLLLVLLATSTAAQVGVLRINPEVSAQLDAADRAGVFVLLRAPFRSRVDDLGGRRRAVRSLRARVLAAVRREDVRIDHEYSIASAFTASVTAAGLAQLLDDRAVLRVDPMQYGSGALAESVPQIRADAVHRRGDLGQGVTVAVLDTGIDPEHPDLARSVVGERCFCSGNCCPGGAADESGAGSALTHATHGIHVAGIIASQGMVAPAGIAPAAKVVAVKVLNEHNRGFLGDWITALEWIVTERPDVQAINMSLVSDSVFSGVCDDADSYNVAFAQVLGVLRARGTLTFTAAGNGGQANALAAPACVGAAVAVGAVTKGDDVWPLSNSDAVLDLLAPGVAILSSGAGGSSAIFTGTSMATAHATGSAALLIALNPALGADRLESMLKASGVRIHDPRNGLVFPRINALGSMNAALDATRPLLGGGSAQRDCLIEWDFSPATRTTSQPFSGAVCRDNDPACDTDQTAGQCTLSVSLCFNVPDRRLLRCTTDAPIVAYTRSHPRTGDAIDAANAAAIDAALLPLPITEVNRCTGPFAFVVPSGAARWIRFSARAADGRMDHDRLRLTCVRAEEDVKR